MSKQQIFISSAQKEFSEERRALKTYIQGDALLSRFFTVYLFEDIPAADRRADSVYLEEVQQSQIYIGLFGNQYGIEDKDGFSPTHKEFMLATKLGKPRFIFVKGNNDVARGQKMCELLCFAGEQVIRRRFNTTTELNAAVCASLVQNLLDSGRLVTGPFDAAMCSNSDISDISEDKIRWFLSRARNARDYALSETTSVPDVLTHLDLLNAGKPNNAAILLFGVKPQRFIIASEIKCMHFHGMQKLKPIPSCQIYKGTVFDLVDKAVDFVMSKLNRYVGTRVQGPEAPVEYDIPQEVVAEGIVNAVAHRDYTGNASIEIMLFSDRLEVWNPGVLPPSLTIKSLRKPHSSQPGNPLVAEPFFLTKYIEKVGTGTVDMYNQCRKAGLKPPEFRIDNGFFILKIWRKKQAGKFTPRIRGEAAGKAGTKSGLSRDKVRILNQPESQPELQPESLGVRILHLLRKGLLGKAELSGKLGQKEISGHLNKTIRILLSDLLIEMTIPDKPNSRLQKYKITHKGKQILQNKWSKKTKK